MITEETKSVSIIEKIVEKYKQFSQKIVIKSNEEYGVAGETLKNIKDAMGRIDDFFNDDIAKANELHKSLTSKKKMFKDPLIAGEANLKNARIAWSNEQERLRKIEQEKLDAEAKRKEDAEKKRLDDKIKKAEEKGDLATAESLKEKKDQVVVMPAQAAPRVEQTSGISQRKTWKAEVTDIKALLLEVSVGRLPITIFEVKQSEIDGLAKAYKNSMQFKGVRFYEKVTEAV